MAERRMFAKTIIDSDQFLDMPLSTQALYFHLAMRADDDGFVNNPKRIQRSIGASDDDCKLLIMKRFILTFDTGVIVIKHWRMHNYIQKDRYKPTVYQQEMEQLTVKENGSYTEAPLPLECTENETSEDCIQNVSKMETQVRLGKVRLDKVSKDNENETAETQSPRSRFKKPTIDEINDYIKEKDLKVDGQYWLDYYESNGWKIGRASMKDWKACLRRWNANEIKKEQPKQAKYRVEDMEADDTVDLNEIGRRLFGE